MDTADLGPIKTILNRVNTISKSYEKVAQATGENFNIFSVLGIEHYEEGTHSRFIANLLNPLGQHGFSNKFLEVFLKEVVGTEIVFDKENYRVKTEYLIGAINKDFTKGGKIDILLTNDRGNIIMIENKIYAKEQPNQLLRYRNAFPNGQLIYLTLKGEESKQESLEKENYKTVSYREDILKWLEDCQKIAVDNPVVRETIKQYKNLIKKLTHINTNTIMNEEIIKLVAESEDNLKNARIISSAIESIQSKLNEKLDQIVEKGTIIKHEHETSSIFDNITLLPRWNEKGTEVIRFDFFLDKDRTKDYVIYEMYSSNEILKLKTKIWGKGNYYDELNKKMTEDINFLNLTDINFDCDIEEVIFKIKANFILINDFLNNSVSNN